MKKSGSTKSTRFSVVPIGFHHINYSYIPNNSCYKVDIYLNFVARSSVITGIIVSLRFFLDLSPKNNNKKINIGYK